MTKEEARAKLRELCDGIVEVVEQFPDGAPAGPMYAAMMTAGCTYEQFERIMSALVTAGRLRKSGHQYFPAK